MRVLWICNTVIPMIADHLCIEATVKEGWITGLARRVLTDEAENGIDLGICVPVARELEGYSGEFDVQIEDSSATVHAFGFFEDVAHPERYDASLEQTFARIIQTFMPDVIHCFGTEYPHTLAVLKAVPDPDRVLVGLQGLCFALADAYRADLPGYVYRRFLLRDLLKWDNIRLQEEKFRKRGKIEQEALKRAVHVTGRTDWDRNQVLSVNPSLTYHFMNETLRPSFYEGCWKRENCEPHSIFVSQGDYPLKGLHFMLQAMPKLLQKYPDTHVYVAGQSIIRYGTLKEKLKISSYGKYLLKLIKQYHLEDHVTFLGRLEEKEMKERYLSSELFLCSSTLENSPNSLGEAMILGMPCVAAAVGGIPSLFSKEEGILFEGGDADALADAIFTMWSDSKRSDQLAAAARKKALCNHDAERNYHTLLQIYEQIAGQ